MFNKKFIICITILFCFGGINQLIGEDLVDNQWVEFKQAKIGKRNISCIIWSPEIKKFLILGGQLHWNAKGDLPYQDLALDLEKAKWENWYPKGKSFGPPFGPCKAPKFKRYYQSLFEDVDGNKRHNQNSHVWRYLYGMHAYDTDAKKIIFYSSEKKYSKIPTWSYDPENRSWDPLSISKDPHPTQKSDRPLLWSSMCYMPTIKKVLLFGGGNQTNERGDVGTWLFDTKSKSWKKLNIDIEPSPRACASMVYDPESKKIILFGGDKLNSLLSETWAFDGIQWENKQPDFSPSPRAGSAFMYLPKAKKTILLGGYDYASGGGYHGQYTKRVGLEAWTFNEKENKWVLIKKFDEKSTAKLNAINGYLKATVSDDDIIALIGVKNITALCQLKITMDIEGTKKLQVKSGTKTFRKKYYDPKWYEEDLPPVEPKKIATNYKSMVVNTWVKKNPPRIPKPNMDWGSGVYIPSKDIIVRFSGGHCAYSGTAPQIYDIKTDRWSIPFSPEFPLEQCNNDGGVPGDWSFNKNPWMPGHTWKSTGLDMVKNRFVYIGGKYTWFFDPDKKVWSSSKKLHPRHDVRVTTLCSTPIGTIAYAYKVKGNRTMVLYKIDNNSGEWHLLPLKGVLPKAGIDINGLSYDSKRNRLLIMAPREKNHEGDLMSYDMKTGDMKWLNAGGKEKALARMRESIYMPDQDMIMVGGRVKDSSGNLVWLFYDCSTNKWKTLNIPGEDPLMHRKKKSAFSNSIGLMYDSSRKLVWIVGKNSELFVLKFDKLKGNLKDL
ncbi:MAG: hypothetical protein COA79_15830 [Planctomycetota bacterium]|nr:MAG: hypothetical protein COA79_15830 [Planctomycetota bacterium]